MLRRATDATFLGIVSLLYSAAVFALKQRRRVVSLVARAKESAR